MPWGNSERVYNVALFGVVKSGKSSIINLLVDKPVANVSSSVEACTRRAQWFPISVEEKSFRVWDTMGFNQVEAKDIDPLSPYEQAYALLQNLQDGIDLILLCARKDRINASLRNLYWLLDSFFFHGRAQIALVLTHFDVPDEGWWDRNVHVIAQRCNIQTQFLPHACITTVQNESSQPDPTYEQSKQTLRALLKEHAVSPTRLPDLSSDTTIEDVAESLRSRCRLNLLDAKTLVQRFGSSRRSFRVILFGEAGVGKSSTINLIAGKPVAAVSSRLESCTMSSCCYEINTGMYQFLIWDTVGFSGGYEGKEVTAMALKNAASLVRDLHAKGGIDLLVFCKKGGRLSRSELSCFRIFQEFLCEGQTPVAFIITHLESYTPTMETWWEKNGEDLVKICNLRMSAVAGHACITAAQDDPDDPGFRHKRSLSRQVVQTMLEDSISYGNAFNKDSASFLRRFGEMAKGSSSRKEKMSITKLKDRYGLTREQANELVGLFNSPAPETMDSVSVAVRKYPSKKSVAPRSVASSQSSNFKTTSIIGQEGNDAEKSRENGNDELSATGLAKLEQRKLDSVSVAVRKYASKKSVAPGGVALPQSNNLKTVPTIEQGEINTGKSRENGGDEPSAAGSAKFEQRRPGLPSLILSFGP